MVEENTKQCEHCGADYSRPSQVSRKQFSNRRFCSRICGRRHVGRANTIQRPEGWKRDRTMEKPWREVSLNYKTRCSRLVSKARNRARDNGVLCTVTTADVIALWDSSGGRCALTGRLFDLGPWKDRFHANPNAPSLDRINPGKDYTATNVRLVCLHVNVALGPYGVEALQVLARDILGFGRNEEW